MVVVEYLSPLFHVSNLKPSSHRPPRTVASMNSPRSNYIACAWMFVYVCQGRPRTRFYERELVQREPFLAFMGVFLSASPSTAHDSSEIPLMLNPWMGKNHLIYCSEWKVDVGSNNTKTLKSSLASVSELPLHPSHYSSHLPSIPFLLITPIYTQCYR